MDQNEIVQYYVVNKELGMSYGKVDAQIAHVATIMAVEIPAGEEAIKKQWFKYWYEHDQPKIILRGKEKDLLKLIEQGAFYIRDLGRTEIPANSLTVIGLPPMPKYLAQKLVKRLQLY